MVNGLLIALNLITVHEIDGRRVDINPDQVTSLVEPRRKDDPAKQFTGAVNCIISFADGKYVSVEETCPEVRALIERGERP